MTTDPIADMLTRIRNASMASQESTLVPYSKIKESIAKILKDTGFIAGYEVAEEKGFKNIVVELTSNEDKTISALVRISKPGRRVYAGSTEIPKVLGGRGMVIVSTSSGLMTGQEARKKGLGGELICKVW